ncbi:hypothetical protein [Enterobacter roggenkampii]|uniref:hypothetical protein n=1 Tax=Enterobacter roggenkampii TaxID=1812935 RepID=UPI001C704C5B|nr:hypothetical protein [Enterobacter roggenkampii]MBW9419948.1 hypothetical protein [Enterobacter roggenkampii]
MSNIDKEWLQKKIAEMEAARDEIPFGLDEDDSNTLAALRIALVSLEAEAVCVIDQANLDYLKSDSDADVWPASRIEMGDVLLYRAAMLQGADRPQNEPQNIPENIPATQFKPVADLYGLTSPTGSETSFTFDAVEARDFIDGGWSCQEYVDLERFHEAITNHTEDKLAMVDHSGDSNNMVEPVTTTYKLPFDQWLSQQTGTIDVECGCVMTEVFFHWLRVAYEAGNSSQCREISNSSTNNFRENAETSTKCWCRTCRPVTFADSHFVVCPECGNKRCPHANDHRNACTGSNEPGQEGSAYPAAPQQEE